jgi:glycosyltransferase involved in cell wall biosynthesis
MKKPKTPLYIFGWPGAIGGARTKLAHLLPLLHEHFSITLIPNNPVRLKEKGWTRRLDRLRVRYSTIKQLPRRLEGIALSLCNPLFFTQRIAHRARDKGLKIIWSSEMMWHHEGELEAVQSGLVDKVLYVSEVQKKSLCAGYGALPWAMTGNYVDPRQFPFQERQHSTFHIGRLSRASPDKYPEDFPVFYECLELPDTRFRVMAWDEVLARKYRWHRFDARWDLLPEAAESQVAFLRSLDLFVYPLGHTVTESWGRSTVEAMLTGCIPLVPAGHHFEHLLVHGQSGFICQDFLHYKEYAQRLCLDWPYRVQLARQCHGHARTKLCDKEQHLKLWLQALR